MFNCKVKHRLADIIDLKAKSTFPAILLCFCQNNNIHNHWPITLFVPSDHYNDGTWGLGSWTPKSLVQQTPDVQLSSKQSWGQNNFWTTYTRRHNRLATGVWGRNNYWSMALEEGTASDIGVASCQGHIGWVQCLIRKRLMFNQISRSKQLLHQSTRDIKASYHLESEVGTTFDKRTLAEVRSVLINSTQSGASI